jgi:hypothetical protein
MNDLDIKPPNAHLLDGIYSGQIDDIMEDIDVNLANLDVSLRPFHDILTISMPLDLDSPALLAIEFDTCHRLLWAHVTNFLKLSTAKCIQKFQHDYSGAYVVSVNESPVFSINNIDCIVDRLCSSSAPPTTIGFELAKECQTEHNPCATPLHLCMHDLQCICALQSVAGEGMAYDEYHDAIDEFASNLTLMEMSAVISRL